MKYLFYFLIIIFYFILIFIALITTIISIKKNIYFILLKKTFFILILVWTILSLIKNNKNKIIKDNENIYLDVFILYMFKNFKEEFISTFLTILFIFILIEIKFFYIILLQFFITITMTLFLFSHINSKRELKENFEISLNKINEIKLKYLVINLWEIPKITAFLINYILLTDKNDYIKKKQTKKIIKKVFYYNILDIPYYLIKLTIKLKKNIKITLKKCNWKEKYKIFWIYIFMWELNKIIENDLNEEYFYINFLVSKMKISENGTNNPLVKEITPSIMAKSYKKNKLIWNLKEVYTPAKHCAIVQNTHEKDNQLVYSKTHSKNLNGIEGSCKTKLLDNSDQFTHQIIISKEQISDKTCWTKFLKNNYVKNSMYSNIALSVKDVSVFYLTKKPYIFHEIKENSKELINLWEEDLEKIKINKLSKTLIFEYKPEMEEYVEKLIKNKYEVEDKKEIDFIKLCIAKNIEEMNEKEVWDNIIIGAELIEFEDELIEIERFKNRTDIF